LKDEQQAAPRPDDLTLDPQYRGFTRIPNTNVLIKFNAKPRTDVTYDTENAGDDNRFITARIPVTGQNDQGGDPRFNINAKGSCSDLTSGRRVAREPALLRERFLRIGRRRFLSRRHLYGQIYNVVVGQTFAFRRSDVWPTPWLGPELGSLRRPQSTARLRRALASERRHRATRHRVAPFGHRTPPR
jgi:hypothetical protein